MTQRVKRVMISVGALLIFLGCLIGFYQLGQWSSRKNMEPPVAYKGTAPFTPYDRLITLKDMSSVPLGTTREEIIRRFGEPNGEIEYIGDYYLLNDGSMTYLTFYRGHLINMTIYSEDMRYYTQKILHNAGSTILPEK